MFFEFKFWKHLFHQGELIDSLNDATMRGFRSRVWVVALLTALLFALRDVWGMHTEDLTYLFVKGFDDTYIIARLVSVIGAILWAVLYFAFFFFGISYLLHKLFTIDLSKLAVIQLFVVSILLMEKAFNFFLYAIAGYTTDYSILSFGPMAAVFLDQPFFIALFDHFSVPVALIIAIQYQFVKSFTEMSARNVFLILIGIQIVLAIISAGIDVLPITKWIEEGI